MNPSRAIQKIVFTLVFMFALQTYAFPPEVQDFATKSDFHVIADTKADLQIKLIDHTHQIVEVNLDDVTIKLNQKSIQVNFIGGVAHLVLPATTKSYSISIPQISQQQKTFRVHHWPGILSIIPPLLAIALAIAFKEVITALFIGVFVGIVFLLGLNDPVNYVKAPLVFIDTYMLDVLTDRSKISVIVFSLLIGGMVSLLIKNASLQYLVQRIISYIKTRRASLFTTWILGILVFFDDYANTLIVGNSARVITDKFSVSRQKLAYIVDSTAAPVASIALITTWIGAQLNYIGDSVGQLGLSETPYYILLNSLPFAFYPILTLFFIFVLIRSGRDFGPMLKAEKLADSDFKKHLKLHPSSSINEENGVQAKFKVSWMDAIIPIAGLIIVAFSSLYYLGKQTLGAEEVSQHSFLGLISIIGSGDPYKAMLWASLFGLGLALVFSLIRRNLSLAKSMLSIVDGFKNMLIAMVILVLAWTLGLITEELHTANFLAAILGENISIVFLPVLVFVIAAAIAFATGTSWGSMALLYPIMLNVVYQSALMNGLSHAETMPYFYQVVAAVLGGSVLGDHCSPISDTTIMSSMASSCNHIEHVRTQMPYALVVGVVSSVFGYLLVSVTGISVLWCLLISALLLFFIIRIFGKKAVLAAD
jgi:Na+/H+ antiporter NhaC